MNPYETLGVPRAATAAEVKAAYRRCCSTAHPDRLGGSTERMQAVNDAYALLSDPARRHRYDATGDTEPPKVEGMAEEIMKSAFVAAVESDKEPVRYCADHIDNAHRTVSAQAATLSSALARLKAKRGKTKVTSGRNLVAEVIDAKIAGIERDRIMAAESLEALRIARVKLAEYIEPAPEPLRGIPINLGGFATAYGATNGGQR